MKAQQNGWWKKREDGAIDFRPSFRSPTYSVSEPDFQPLRKARSQEMLVMILLGVPLFAAIMLWLHGKVSWQNFSIAVLIYALIGIWFQLKTRKAMQDVLKLSTISTDKLSFENHFKQSVKSPATLLNGAFGYLFDDIGFTAGLFFLASFASFVLRAFGFSEVFGQAVPSHRLSILLLFVGMALLAINTFRSKKLK